MVCECPQIRIIEEIVEYLEKSRELMKESRTKDSDNIYEALECNSKVIKLIEDLRELHESGHVEED